MKLQKTSIDALKSFSTINQSILLKQGSKQKTISVAKNVFAEIQLDDEFPLECGIYNLPEFLSTLSLFTDPTLDFKENHVMIFEGDTKLKYTYSDPEVIISPPEKDITMPSVEVAFDIKHEDFEKLIKAANVLGLSDMQITNKQGKINAGVTNKGTDSENEFAINVGDMADDYRFNAQLRVSLLNLLPDDYHVELSSKGFSRWIGKTNNAVYFVAMETTSTFD